MAFYTYLHRRADDGRVFYVGKGAGQRAGLSRGRSEHWRRVADKHGRTVEILAQWPAEAEAFEHEKFLIACFRGLGAPLVNRTDGGEGSSGHKFSEASRAKMSAWQVGRKLSKETCEKMRSARRGKRPSDRSVAAITHRAKSVEERSKIATALRGKKKSPEHCAALRAAWVKRKGESRA